VLEVRYYTEKSVIFPEIHDFRAIIFKYAYYV